MLIFNSSICKSIVIEILLFNYLNIKIKAHHTKEIIRILMATNFESSIGKMNMCIEWHRITTFSHFPTPFENVSEINLAKAGFYRIGSKQVKCYSCGMVKEDWKYLENPWEIHKKCSPKCFHINNKDSNNIPIHKECIRPTYLYSSSHRDMNSERRNDNEHTAISNGGLASVATSLSSVSSSTPTLVSNSAPPAYSTTNTSSTASSYLVSSTSTHQRDNTHHRNNGQQPLPVENLGVNLDRPRYPAYAIPSVREKTFQGWPSYLPQTAKQMSQAGFIFAGYSDYTRCFFCGGGLRNWDPEDDPWVEHARWFPKCAFVRQNKGEKWVNDVLQACADHVKNVAGISSNNVPETNTVENLTKRNVSSGPETPAESDIWSNAAVQSVLEMKYDKGIILQAISTASKHKDMKALGASDILEAIFDIEEQSLACDISSLSVTEDTSIPTCPSVEDKPTTEEETRQVLQENAALKELQICKVCRENEVAIVFLPCGHYVTCMECAPAMRKCPACDILVKGSIKAWLA